MKGLSTKAVEAIEKLIESKFDAISLRLIGLIPKLSKQKRIIFSTSKNNLISLFLQSLGSRKPNQTEEQALKTSIRIASGYMDALKSKTTSKIIQDVDSYIRNQNNKKEPISAKKVRETIFADMEKAKSNLSLIANSETNNSVNFGTAMKIAKMGEQQGDPDPTVFFVVTVDDVTGPEEFVLHLLPDKSTPRVWKLSEVGSEYHKRGDPNPKLPGLHPNCRCKLTKLPDGYGFDNKGYIKYIDRDYNEFDHQRKEYGKAR